MKECADNIHTLRTDSSICVDCGFDCGTEVTSSPPIQDLTIREILESFYEKISGSDLVEDRLSLITAHKELTQLLLREKIKTLAEHGLGGVGGLTPDQQEYFEKVIGGLVDQLHGLTQPKEKEK